MKPESRWENQKLVIYLKPSCLLLRSGILIFGSYLRVRYVRVLQRSCCGSESAGGLLGIGWACGAGGGEWLELKFTSFLKVFILY